MLDKRASAQALHGDSSGGIANCVHGSLDIRLIRRPVAHRHTQHILVVPSRTRHPHGAVGDETSHDVPGASIIAKANADLRVVDVVEHARAFDGRDALGQGLSVPHESLHEVGNAGASQ